MDLSQLQTLFSAARKLGGQTEFVVVGSLSILGVVQHAAEIPARMLMSIDVDCYTRPDPGRPTSPVRPPGCSGTRRGG